MVITLSHSHYHVNIKHEQKYELTQTLLHAHPNSQLREGPFRS